MFLRLRRPRSHRISNTPSGKARQKCKGRRARRRSLLGSAQRLGSRDLQSKTAKSHDRRLEPAPSSQALSNLRLTRASGLGLSPSTWVVLAWTRRSEIRGSLPIHGSVAGRRPRWSMRRTAMAGPVDQLPARRSRSGDPSPVFSSPRTHLSRVACCGSPAMHPATGVASLTDSGDDSFRIPRSSRARSTSVERHFNARMTACKR